VIAAVLFSATMQGQEPKPAGSLSTAALEFPVVMQQNLTSGKTAIGTKIQARLTVATLLDGTVIPKNAVFSGEVIESVAKSATGPSCLAIRMDSAEWKGGTVPVKVYLTAWYYPEKNVAGQDLQYGPSEPANKTWNGQGQYPDPNSKVYQPFPTSGSDKSGSIPDAQISTTSNRRAWMKDVESATSSDGEVAIANRRTNIKLDKLTTYVLAASELRPTK
jgi:hypothetical protein